MSVMSSLRRRLNKESARKARAHNAQHTPEFIRQIEKKHDRMYRNAMINLSTLEVIGWMMGDATQFPPAP